MLYVCILTYIYIHISAIMYEYKWLVYGEVVIGNPQGTRKKSSMSAMLNNHRIPAVVRSVVRTKRTSEPRPNRDVPSSVRGLEGNLTSNLATIWAFGNEIHPRSSEIQDPYVILPAPRLPRLHRALSCLTSASHWLSGAASDSSCKASVTGSMLHCERFVLFATWKGKTIYIYIYN